MRDRGRGTERQFRRSLEVAAAAALTILAAAVPAVAATPTSTEFTTGFSAGAHPQAITTGPDGNLWFVDTGPDKIGRITPSGTVTEFSAGITAGSFPTGITAGPDGNLWFTESLGGRVARITPTGTVTEFGPGISPGSTPGEIASGPDGNLWYTDYSGDRVGRVTTSGVVTEFSVGISPGAQPSGITTGPDGNLWFTEFSGQAIGRITPSGVVTEFSSGLSPSSFPLGIAAGPDGNLWFTENGGSRIGRITPSGTVTEFGSGITGGAALWGIASGPDGNLWFSERASSAIGRINTEDAPPSFSNTQPIAVPGSGTSGPAAPYPSQITVSGLQGTVTDVRARLIGLFHTYPGDVDFLLVSPAGEAVLLSADDPSLRRPVAAGVTLSLSDKAPFPLPTVNLRAPLVSGLYRATRSGSTAFPAPSPNVAYGGGFSNFAGTAPNGAWSLYVEDEGSGDTGTLAGWGLDIDTTGPAPVHPPLTLTLEAPRKQKAKKLQVVATCSVECLLSARAKGTAGGHKFKSKPADASGSEGIGTKIKLRVSGGTARAIAGERGKARIKVTATTAFEAVTKTFAVKLR